MRRFALLTGLFVLCLALGCAQNVVESEINHWYETAGRGLVPKTEKKRILAALKEAGANWRQLASALEGVNPECRSGMRYLLANMPNYDLLAMRSDILIENVEYSYIARERLPWGKTIPEQLFRTAVLPYRATSEPIEKWRKDFFERLYPLVYDCKSTGEAAVKVNQWAASVVTYKPSTLVQGPYEMLKSGYGRCGELTNFLVEASRAVCIPARSAYTPWWPMRDDDHAWPEIWDTQDESWHFIGAAEPAPLDHTWFDKIVKRTGKVFAREFKRAETARRERLHERKDLKDVTKRYVDGMGILRVKVLRAGKPATNVQVKLSVWNFSSLRPTASATTDNSGIAEIEIGAGIYLLTAGTPEFNTWQLIEVDKDEVKEVDLELTRPKREELVRMQ